MSGSTSKGTSLSSTTITSKLVAISESMIERNSRFTFSLLLKVGMAMLIFVRLVARFLYWEREGVYYFEDQRRVETVFFA